MHMQVETILTLTLKKGPTPPQGCLGGYPSLAMMWDVGLWDVGLCVCQLRFTYLFWGPVTLST